MTASASAASGVEAAFIATLGAAANASDAITTNTGEADETVEAALFSSLAILLAAAAISLAVGAGTAMDKAMAKAMAEGGIVSTAAGAFPMLTYDAGGGGALVTDSLGASIATTSPSARPTRMAPTNMGALGRTRRQGCSASRALSKGARRCAR